MPKVSVIIPVYNVDEYLRQCMDSVVNQTLHDIEIICVDDGSTDGSAAILQEYAAKDCRIKVIPRAHTNAGEARNAGMAAATGEYLGFVDSDDFVEPSLFAKAYAKAKSDDSDIVFFGYRMYDERTGELRPGRAVPGLVAELVCPFRAEDLKLLAFDAFNLAPWNRIVRRTLVEAHGLRFQSLPRSNDVSFGCVALAVASRISHLAETLYIYRTGLSTNLQSGNVLSPTTLIEAWEDVADELVRVGRLEPLAAPLATVATGALFYALNTWQSVDVYERYYACLKNLFSCHAFYSKLDASLIANTQSLAYCQMLRGSVSAEDFLLRQELFNLPRLSKWLNENVALRKRQEDLKQSCTEWTPPRRTISVFVVGENEEALEQTLMALKGQSLLPEEILCLGDADADKIEEAVAVAKGEMICFFQVGQRPATASSLEKGALAIDCFGEKHKRRPNDEIFGTVFSRTEVTRAVCEFAAWPQEVAQVTPNGQISAEMRRRLIGVAQSLVALDVRNLSGRFFELLGRVFVADKTEATRCFVSRLMHDLDYEHYREFLSDAAWRRWRGTLDVAYNLAYEEISLPDLHLPTWKVSRAASRPRITYVVPAMNVELYLPRCLESLRRQTMEDVEIICIDDGSQDSTGEIMDRYASLDARIKVVHQENKGLGESRNVAIGLARGEYISFVDGDDYLAAETAAVALDRCERCHLDFCSYDMRGFNYATRAAVPFFWNVSRQIAYTPVDRVVSLDDFKCLRLSVSACLSLYRMSFLKSQGLSFSGIGYGEDMIFTFTALARAERFMVLNRPYYNYRRGQPASMVTRLSAGNNTADALSVQREKYMALLKLYNDVYRASGSEHLMKLFRENVIIDLLYYGERSEDIRRLFAQGIWDGLDMPKIAEGDVDASLFKRKTAMQRMLDDIHAAPNEAPAAVQQATINAPPLPSNVARRLAAIERRRRESAHDTYIVTGQLNSTTNEPIDSWTFFTWLQKNGIPSRYVIWRRHAFYSEIVHRGALKDVIALDGDGVGDYEFLDRTADVLPRVKAIVQENSALNYGLRKWVVEESDIAHVFLQHGMFFTAFSPAVARILGQFDFVNVASERERRFILDRTPQGSSLTPEKLIIGGLPRWDLLKDESNEPGTGNVVFVMLTWRASFNAGVERLRKSAYYNRLREFLSERTMARMKALGVRVVLAPHHHLANAIKDLDFGVPVEMASPGSVSYWIRHAKMLVTDFSSVSIDFLFQNKPVVYWILDRDDFLLDRSLHDDGGKVASAVRELKALFNVVDSSQETVDAICRYADRSFALEPENRAIAESLFAHRRDICRHVYEAIERAVAGKENP